MLTRFVVAQHYRVFVGVVVGALSLRTMSRISWPKMCRIVTVAEVLIGCCIVACCEANNLSHAEHCEKVEVERN